ncbi:hypothetical protein CJ030_MR6G021656 [Morella rubra]|nr:hypothetical protein CJ030_MR6G021656 [Morella rubra]
MQEADLLQGKLEEMDEIEKNLRAELEAALITSQLGRSSDSVVQPKMAVEDGPDTEASKSALLEKLENKKKELSSMEEVVQDLEKRWAQVQDKALKQPSPAQREKKLDKQLHSLIEQLAAKQAQAESLVSEIHVKQMDLERLNGLWRIVESSNIDANTARNRFGRSTSERGSASSDYTADAHLKPTYYPGGRSENHQKLMLLRSTFVLYIFALHILVFIKISL